MKKEDKEFLIKFIKFETYILQFILKYPRKIYYLIFNKGYVIHYLELNIFHASKLLKSQFLWIVIVTSLFNKTQDFHEYTHLFYNNNWALSLKKDFCDLSIIEKFIQAFTCHKKLELFNLVYIYYFTVQGHIPAVEVAIIIPILLK